MALVAPNIKAKFKKRIQAGLKREFSAAAAKGAGFPPVADEFWAKLADAISDIAIDLVDEMHNSAEVAPGIPTATGPTIGKGKIL